MRQIFRAVVALIFLLTAIAGIASGQGSKAISVGNQNDGASEVVRELRLTRQAFQQFRKELRQLQIAAIRIGVQQDAIATREARLDFVRSEVAVTQDALDEVQDRIKRLEAVDTTDADDAERQRLRVETAEGKKERDRTQQKLDTLRLLDSQLTTEIQAERGRLAEMIVALEAIIAERVSDPPETQPKTGDPKWTTQPRGVQHEK
jgi:chromosome segregation ATPase